MADTAGCFWLKDMRGEGLPPGETTQYSLSAPVGRQTPLAGAWGRPPPFEETATAPELSQGLEADGRSRSGGIGHPHSDPFPALLATVIFP
jgi:hypothetical protein